MEERIAELERYRWQIKRALREDLTAEKAQLAMMVCDVILGELIRLKKNVVRLEHIVEGNSGGEDRP